jgi:hypothetical protein
MSFDNDGVAVDIVLERAFPAILDLDNQSGRPEAILAHLFLLLKDSSD